MSTFSDLATAAYCPRQLYYARRDDDRGPPDEALRRRNLAFRYPELRQASEDSLAALPIDRPPAEYRDALDRLAARDDWESLVDPLGREVRLEGKDCRGVAHKLLAGDPPTPVVVSPGTPPEDGVWKPQRVRAVATAKALAWERQRDVSRALVEYPASGVVRRVDVTVRNGALYRRTLRAVRSLDGPPPRLQDRSKCNSCSYLETCGVRTRSLRSLL